MHLKLHSHMAKPDKAASMAPAVRNAPTCPCEQQRKPSAATPTIPYLPRTSAPENSGLGRKGEM